jgi:hypothetical protein
LPAFADNLVINGSFEGNFGAGQFNQTLPGSAGGQSAATPGTTATDWTVTGTNSSYPQGYAFIFGNADSFTTTNAFFLLTFLLKESPRSLASMCPQWPTPSS